MGRRGPLPKPKPLGRAPRKTTTLVPVQGFPSAEPPEADEAWLDGTKELWTEFWGAPISTMVQDTEIAIVRRLFEYRDQHARASEIVRTSPVVRGSVGQVRINPLADYVQKLETAMVRLENELGLTPLSRQRLGYAVGETARSLSQLMQDDEIARRRREDRAKRLGEA